MSLARADRGQTRGGRYDGVEASGDGGRGNDATIPLPAGDLPGASAAPVTSAGPVTSGRPGLGTVGPAAPRRHRIRRVLLRAAGAVAALSLLAIMAFGGLLLVTPSVGNAPALARLGPGPPRALPGPAGADRFAAALVATEDKRFYSEPGHRPVRGRPGGDLLT